MLYFKFVVVILYAVILWGIYRAVTVYNPVYAVLYLILAFLALCALLIFLSADYLAILFVLIYGGAISILIMFVIMMLDLKELEVRKPGGLGFVKFLCLFVTLGLLLFLVTTENEASHIPPMAYYNNWFKISQAKDNIEVIGIAFFNHYNFQFIFMGFILFLSMIIIISLVIRKQERARSQILHEQLKENNIKMLMFK